MILLGDNQNPPRDPRYPMETDGKYEGQWQDYENRTGDVDQGIFQSLVKFRIIDRILEIFQTDVTGCILPNLLLRVAPIKKSQGTRRGRILWQNLLRREFETRQTEKN